MITYALRCDHADCTSLGPTADTETRARRDALGFRWQRWERPTGELLDLCPFHHQPPAG